MGYVSVGGKGVAMQDPATRKIKRSGINKKGREGILKGKGEGAIQERAGLGGGIIEWGSLPSIIQMSRKN